MIQKSRRFPRPPQKDNVGQAAKSVKILFNVSVCLSVCLCTRIYIVMGGGHMYGRILFRDSIIINPDDFFIKS